VDQTGLATAPYVLQRLLFRYPASKPGVDPQYRFPKKETAQTGRIVFTAICVAADANIHDPVIISSLDEVLHHFGRQHQLTSGVDGLVDRDHPVLGKVDQVVAVKEPPLSDISQDGQLGRPGSQKAARVCLLEKFHEP
jgi:hypothetical protein